MVTNLKDDVYLDGSGQLRTVIENLSKRYDRNPQGISALQKAKRVDTIPTTPETYVERMLHHPHCHDHPPQRLLLKFLTLPAMGVNSRSILV